MTRSSSCTPRSSLVAALGNLRRADHWAIFLLILVLTVVGCQGADATATSDDGQPADAVTTKEPAAVTDTELTEAQLFTVGFTSEGHPFQGNPDAAVTIEEYSSYQCPFCGRYFSEAYPELKRQYVDTGKVLYIFKDFPLSGQPQSPKAAEAARCAGDIDGAQAYWDMHDRLFTGQRDWSGNSDADKVFTTYATELGIAEAAFQDCLGSGRTSDHVQGDSSEGMTRGVRGTPSFFINGQVLVGAQPLTVFAEAIDNALAGKPISSATTSADNSAAATQAAPAAEIIVPTPAVFAFQTEDKSEGLFAMGDAKAPVTIVEFTDYQCPYCSQYAQQTWPTVKQNYVDTGRVYYVLKDFPITSIHAEAFKAHEAARCAAELGGNEANWQMHDRLFEAQDEWAGNSEHTAVFESYATELGIDEEAFATCLDDGEYTAAVQANVDEGLALGVRGTPTFFVAGYPFSGAMPIEFFDQAITLAESGQLGDAIAEALARAQAQQAQPRPTAAPADVPIGDAPVKGDPDAPITIVEYSDYQCPFCARHFAETWPQLIENFVESGKARYVFKDFPLTSIHPQAPKAHEASRCAREVGGDEAYWKMHDRLFVGQSEWAGNPDHVTVFKSYAVELGLDKATFDACLDSGRYASNVQADLEEGVGFGVTGTPAFFVNGQPVEGAQPYQVFEQLIKALLNESLYG